MVTTRAGWPGCATRPERGGCQVKVVPASSLTAGVRSSTATRPPPSAQDQGRRARGSTRRSARRRAALRGGVIWYFEPMDASDATGPRDGLGEFGLALRHSALNTPTHLSALAGHDGEAGSTDVVDLVRRMSDASLGRGSSPTRVPLVISPGGTTTDLWGAALRPVSSAPGRAA
jgi:hypothetical protein